MKRVLIGCVIYFIGSVAFCRDVPKYRAGFVAQAPDTGVELSRPGINGKAPDSWAWIFPSPIPGAVVIEQVTTAYRDPVSSHVCFYLVKGYDGIAGMEDDPKALLAALKPDNVLQFSCERKFMQLLPEDTQPISK